MHALSLLTSTRPPFREAVWLNAMAAVAVGMFLGYWVIGPAISTDTPDHAPLRSAAFDRKALDQAAAQPDPSPYRTPTPQFDTADAPHYAEAAKQRAQALYGARRATAANYEHDIAAGREAFDALPPEEPPEIEAPAPRQSSRYPRLDRHTGVRY